MSSRKIVLGLLVLALLGVGAWLVIPPQALLAPRPEWIVVEGPVNAWHDYHKLGGEAAKKNADKPAVAEQLVKAAKKSQSQRFYKAPAVSPTEEIYNYRDEKALGQLAAEQVGVLAAQGQTEKALDLALAGYKMGTDLAEPGSDLTPVLAAIVVRREVARPLQSLLPKLNADQAKRALSAITALDLQMPAPGVVLTWDRDALARGLEDSLKAETPPLPGLRTRMLNSIQDRIQRQTKLLSEAMDSWDPARVQAAQQEANAIRTDSRYLKEAVPSLDTNLSAALRQFYLDRVGGAGLECQAALAVYRSEHGKLPEKLEEALTPPNDPRTGKPPRYKLEGQGAIIVYPGPDGTDDNGYQQVDPEKPNGDKGADMVFRFP